VVLGQGANPQELGWRPNVNLQIDFRYGNSNNEQIIAAAKELVAAQPEVLEVTSTPGTAAVLRETHTIPVIFSIVSDPVGAGFVQSLPHPGGNATGFINIEDSMGGKWLELLKEIVPRISRVVIVFNPVTAPQADYYRRAVETAAPSFAIITRAAPVSNMTDIQTEIANAAQDGNTGLLVLPDTFTLTHRKDVIALANGAKVPAVFPSTPFVEAGGLLSYGVDTADLQRRAAAYVDAVLKGAKTIDLPVQLPTKFELAVNPKTAKALGLTVPPVLLATADEVIE
jgi:putative ABC transport system substrate-binding protein